MNDKLRALADVLALLEKATPGKWYWNDDDQMVSKDEHGLPVRIIETDSGVYPPKVKDRAAIAACVNYLRTHGAALLSGEGSERSQVAGGVTKATIREACDTFHIECRFSDGQKFAAVHVEKDCENLAYEICQFLNLESRANGQATTPTAADGREADDPTEKLKWCREDWQAVCDALGANGEHMDPPDVVKAIEAARKAAEAAPVADGAVAWVEVSDTHEGPYEFHGDKLLPPGKHLLYTHPHAASAKDAVTNEMVSRAMSAYFDALHPNRKIGAPPRAMRAALEAALQQTAKEGRS